VFRRLFCIVFIVFIAIPVFASENTGTVSGKVKVLRARRSANVVVYLQDVPGTFKPSEKHSKMDQRNLIFIPHVLPVLVGTTVDFPNSDTVNHNVLSTSKTKKFNLGTYSKAMVKQVTFDKKGVVALLCNVHTEMSAYVVVLPNPYFARTDNDGRFTIANIPPGQYTLEAWHEDRRPYRQTVTIEAGKTTEITIELSR